MQTGDVPVAPDAAGTAATRTVLFDFDGVLIHGDAFTLFMRERYARAWARRLLALLALPWLLIQMPVSRWLPVRSMVHIGLLGLNETRYVLAARAFAAALVRRPKQFNRDALQALRRHQAAGDRVVVVTGCEQVLAESILAELGLGAMEVVASRLRQGMFGMRVKMHNIGRQKPRQLAAHGIATWQVAYSDSAKDIPMLKGATEAVLVNATPAVCKKVERALGRTVIRVDWF